MFLDTIIKCDCFQQIADAQRQMITNTQDMKWTDEKFEKQSINYD